ncbi:CpsD/CapB family tyrosine-protein kinase [Clostridium tarantellae]|uniref:non-specific protein-tyrosine kinase n=1 Tax=Clostridium tarantellae TaxID=39493 RepID=A0A6I1MS53_9CLOT|nr:CpsD/CapB family tyrosine-protein kinase [Clostridium tarantellae]MPQ45288.1 polysaccharide biosynthesis tyrosine autokinase [Clostridium tarantellae]
MFIVEENPKSIVAEAYRTLRTNIKYSSFDTNIKSIIVTSSIVGEGKSTIAGNLAISMAKDGKKTLLLDCDLRKPTLHKKFKISNLYGLSEVLLGEKSVDDILNKHHSGLHIVTAGKVPPNPSEMLGSRVMTNLIEDLKMVYDYIILDSPPVNAVADPQISATIVDGTIFVIKAESTKKDEVDSAINELKKVNANLIGVVLNEINENINKYNYYYEENSEK